MNDEALDLLREAVELLRRLDAQLPDRQFVSGTVLLDGKEISHVVNVENRRRRNGGGSSAA